MNILHSRRGFASYYAVQVLIDKSLIKIDDCGVRMHDMIEDMGREIVRLESPSKLGECSRLWFSKDIIHVFKENKTPLFFFTLNFKKFLYPNNGNRSSNLLSGPMQDPDVQIHESMDRTPKDFEHPGCPHLSVSELNLANSVVEPKTSIEFPVVLDNLLDGEQNYSFNSEVMSACLLYLVVKFLQPLMTLSVLSLATVTLLRRF
ncbi:TMV resistance protein N [Trifolium repens]|nr:TMV resistance protein N [Trifolium repens]